jgi:hypothetical protein
MIIYQGPSEIDGSPVVAIITGLNTKSSNSKTGDMPQVWILRSDMHPVDALRTGADKAICGNCPHRPQVTGADALKKSSRTCYVNVMSFNGIYKAFAGGKYAVANLEELSVALTGKHVRIGAYGDPAAVPVAVWDVLLANCRSTGYTHQWRTCDQKFASYCMASCDNPIDVSLATSEGYRTFYVQNVESYDIAERTVGAIKMAHCPASKEMGRKTTCSACMACSGTRSGLHSNITIVLH